MKRKTGYPMGTVSHSTMRNEDLIPIFRAELERQHRQRRIARSGHGKLARKIAARERKSGYYDSDEAGYDLDVLFDALSEYAAPYFYFGAHPGDGSDYGYWLSESWDEDFESISDIATNRQLSRAEQLEHSQIKVSDLSEVPSWFRGEVAVVNDHGNVTLYHRTARGELTEIWNIV